MTVEIIFDSDLIERTLERLRDVPYALQRAVYPAVSEVLEGVKDHLSEYLTSDVPIDPKAARKALKMRMPMSSGGFILGSVSVSSKMLPLIYYDVQPKSQTAQSGLRPAQWPDFTFSLRRGDRRAGRSRIQGSSLPFIARMPTGHLGVYYRTGTGIKQSYGPTVQYHVATPEIESAFADRANRRFPELLGRYADQALAGSGG